MKHAEVVSDLATCKSLKVGAVAVKGNHIIATGYNGVPSGFQHCEDREDISREDHKEFSDKFEVHAEMNVIMDALERGQNLKGATVYTTTSPCWNCAKHMKRAGVDVVYYKEQYHRVSDVEMAMMNQELNLPILKV